jgi:hypothetical protein
MYWMDVDGGWSNGPSVPGYREAFRKIQPTAGGLQQHPKLLGIEVCSLVLTKAVAGPIVC